jgi:hypothetical protein
LVYEQLFWETFDSIDFTGVSGSDPRRFGVPTNDGQTDGNSATIGNADNDNKWYAARFEDGDGGAPYQDVGAQKFGGSGNSTPVGLAEDDAGLLIPVNTTNYENIQLKFDWRTFSAASTDKVVVGYFVGDLLGVISPSLIDLPTRSLDLRASETATGSWSNWTQLLHESASDSFTTEIFNLGAAASDKAQVWIAFWLDNGEGDYLKIDNIMVTGTLVPVPAALPLLISGLLGFGLLRRRKG